MLMVAHSSAQNNYFRPNTNIISFPGTCRLWAMFGARHYARRRRRHRCASEIDTDARCNDAQFG